ncbi:hypothetical protein BDV93DRAFT_521502 [Ceratobasidium sp. AG-I]|nr:hypothetical protein BDV93DRAFT_521502 [Ceratobasidium sp. AG-I]
MANATRPTTLASPTRQQTLVRSPGLLNLRPTSTVAESSVPFPRESSPMTPSGAKSMTPAPSVVPTSGNTAPAAAAPALVSTDPTSSQIDPALAELDSATRALTLEAYVRREMGTQYEALRIECEREIEEFLRAAKETRAKIAAL